MKLVSFEEIITCVLAGLLGIAIYFFARRFLSSPLQVSLLASALLGALLAIVTSTRFVLDDRAIKYGSLFWREAAPLAQIEKVLVRPSLGLIPGRSVLIFWRQNAPTTMTSVRIGIFSWPHAEVWTQAVNEALSNLKN
jgi:uncharacterized integral membrane protein